MICLLETAKKLNFCYNYMKKETTDTPATVVFMSLVTLRNYPSEMFLAPKTVFIKLLENF